MVVDGEKGGGERWGSQISGPLQPMANFVIAKYKLNYLEHPIPAAPVPAFAGKQVPPEALAAHAAWVNGQKEITVLMLMTMEPDLQWNLENLGVYGMLQELKTLFSQQAYYIDNLECLGHPVSLSLAMSLILVSLCKEYDSFVQNYNMHDIGKTVNELHAMLKLHEKTLPKKDAAPALHAIRAGKILPPPKKDNPTKDAICHHCGDVGHWKRNCPQYLAELLKNKKLSQGSSTSVSQKEVENQLGKTIKLLRSDHGGEYMSQEFLDHIKEHGIIAHQTPSYTPQHNDVSKRRNRTQLDMVSTKKVEKIPYEIWHGQALKLSYLKVWGCEALVKRDTLTKPDKLEPRSLKCIFIGYPKETMGYSFYYPLKNRIFVAQNAEFLENSLMTQEASGSLEDLEIIQEEDTHPSKNASSHHDEDDQEF
ncbi:zinc finger, CCHC-type containing protein [Tanacetum coccineum]